MTAMDAPISVKMDNHLIAFVDLLGFRSIITGQDDLLQHRVLSILTKISETKSDFKIETRVIDATRREISVLPSISAFSDHLVFSLPAAHVDGLTVISVANLIADIFSDAIRIGCLVRGGVSFGRLYHKHGVLFGPGLVEAYELESNNWIRTIRELCEGQIQALTHGLQKWRSFGTRFERLVATLHPSDWDRLKARQQQ
jgi:hypothetical protein